MSTSNLTQEQINTLNRVSDPVQRAAFEAILIKENEDKAAEREARKAQQQENREVFAIKLQDLGNFSCYGLKSKFPFTFYVDQWNILMENREVIEKFIADNKAVLEARYAKRNETRKLKDAEDKRLGRGKYYKKNK